MLLSANASVRSDSQPISLALVGAGVQGSRHLASVARLSAELNIRLAAIVDIDPRAADLAHAHNTAFLCGLAALPEMADACIVATPTATHFEIASVLLRNGIDILVEKPVTAQLAHAESLVRLADEHGRIFQVGYQNRHHLAYTLVQPDFSAPTQIISHRSTVRQAIRNLPELVLELMIHDLDMISAWLDCEPVEIIWRNASANADAITGVLELGFSDGHRARLFAQSGSRSAIHRTTVRGAGQTWEFRWGSSTRPTWAVSDNAGQTDAGGDPISRQLRSFAHAVRTRSSPMIDGHAAVRAMRLGQRAIHALSSYEPASV